MNTNDPITYVHLLVDNGLLAEVSASYTETDPRDRPTWMAPIYPERALAVSPLLIDLEAAYEAGALDQVMRYLNALRPALHVSVIETAFKLEQLAQHLRRFIFILDPEGKQFTFRYADCAVLEQLPSVLTPSQWAAMAGPITRWAIHGRSGSIVRLPQADPLYSQPIPVCLNRDQLAILDEASEPDHYIMKVKMMRNHETLPGGPLEQHQWAKSAREQWRSFDNKNSLILSFLTEATIMTRGKILLEREIHSALKNRTSSEFGEITKALIERLE